MASQNNTVVIVLMMAATIVGFGCTPNATVAKPPSPGSRAMSTPLEPIKKWTSGDFSELPTNGMYGVGCADYRPDSLQPAMEHARIRAMTDLAVQLKVTILSLTESYQRSVAAQGNFNESYYRAMVRLIVSQSLSYCQIVDIYLDRENSQCFNLVKIPRSSVADRILINFKNSYNTSLKEFEKSIAEWVEQMGNDR